MPNWRFSDVSERSTGSPCWGVAVLVKDSLRAAEKEVPGDTRSLELLWIRVELSAAVLFVGALYHPPRPIYRVEVLLERLERSVETLVQMEPRAIIVLGEDFNRLDEREVAECTGLTPLINEPTRGENILDRLYVSEHCFSTVKILASAIKTGHKAIIALSTDTVTSQRKEAQRVAFRKRTPQQHSVLFRELTYLDLSYILTSEEPHAAWDLFYKDPTEIGKIIPYAEGHNDHS